MFTFPLFLFAHLPALCSTHLHVRRRLGNPVDRQSFDAALFVNLCYVSKLATSSPFSNIQAPFSSLCLICVMSLVTHSFIGSSFAGVNCDDPSQRTDNFLRCLPH